MSRTIPLVAHDIDLIADDVAIYSPIGRCSSMYHDLAAQMVDSGKKQFICFGVEFNFADDARIDTDPLAWITLLGIIAQLAQIVIVILPVIVAISDDWAHSPTIGRIGITAIAIVFFFNTRSCALSFDVRSQ